MLGPANYDPECARARLSTQARMAVLLVVGGRRGGGMSIQVHRDAQGDLVQLPQTLRTLADEVERALAMPAAKAQAKLKTRRGVHLGPA
jgi:FixJ family two-component response regulator